MGNNGRHNIKRKDVDPVDFDTEGNPPDPDIERVEPAGKKHRLPSRLVLILRKASATVWQFGRRHRKKSIIGAALLLSYTTGINIKPVLALLGVTETQTSLIMEFLTELTGGETVVTILIGVLFVAFAAGWVYERWSKGKIKGVLGEILDNSDDAAHYLLQATDKQSKGGQRVVFKEYIKAAKILIGANSEQKAKKKKTKK